MVAGGGSPGCVAWDYLCPVLCEGHFDGSIGVEGLRAVVLLEWHRMTVSLPTTYAGMKSSSVSWQMLKQQQKWKRRKLNWHEQLQPSPD